MCVRSRRLRVSTFLLVARTNLANRSKETDKYHSKKENAAVAAFKSADSQHLRVDFEGAARIRLCHHSGGAVHRWGVPIVRGEEDLDIGSDRGNTEAVGWCDTSLSAGTGT